MLPARRIALALAVAAPLAAGGCRTSTVEQHTAALTPASETVALRQLQGRRFDTSDEAAILASSVAVLQDLGFAVEESSATTGFVVGSKDRDAVEAGQVAGQIVLAALVAALGAHHDPVWDKDQKIRIAIVTKPVFGSILVRVTFQRLIRNTRNQVSRVETINDAQIYQEFFDKLSQAVFLEAHQI